MHRLSLYSLFLLCFLLPACREHSRENRENEFIENLLRQMTLDEKIGQMVQHQGIYTSDEKNAVRNGLVGSYLSFDPDSANAWQRVAVEESRLKIPLVFALDVIHGYKTVFPVPLGMAASFNPELMQKTSRIAALEAMADGIRWTFAPMIDVSRDSRWGRIAESFGEDPVLAAVMGVASLRGFQEYTPEGFYTLAACAKHFAGYGASEGGKDYNSTQIPERLMRNIYLYPFEQVARHGIATFMTSFNDNDGIPMTGNSYYTRKVLRDEWKFDGVLVSDWEAVKEMTDHGFAADSIEAAKKAIQAGVDIEMVSQSYPAAIAQLLAAGKLSRKEIDESVRNVLRLKYRLGLFEHPYYDDKSEKPFYRKAHLEAAKEAALQSVVLLKNENRTLPLSPSVKKIAVLGPMADAPAEQLGCWVIKGESARTVTPFRALKKKYGNRLQIAYDPVLKNSRDESTRQFDRAISLARNSDIVLLFLGEEAFLSGEGHSLADIRLLGAQKELLAALKKTGKPIVTIIMAGRALTIYDELKNSDALLYAWHPGTMGGEALAELLFGEASPSGKLPVTFPRHVGQLPLYYNHHNTGRPAPDPVMTLDSMARSPQNTTIGYKAAYLDYGKDPLLPFGFGLSYTTFGYSDLQFDKKEIVPGETVSLSCRVSNTGDFSGTEIVQLYLHDQFASVARPVLELKDFKRIALRPGESKEVTFTLTPDILSFYGIEMKRCIEPGVFDIKIGASSADIRLTDSLTVLPEKI